MLANLIFLIILSSGSAFASVYYKKNYADILPITASCIIFIQFSFGILNNLEFGFLFSFGICLTLWILAFIKLFKTGTFNAAAHAFFSREFWVFIVLYIGLNFFLVGMQAHEWDEFSHWATVVKAMVQEGCLAYHPKAHLTFGDYPPGMALFQYFLQKIYIFCGKSDFSEWRLYLAYIILAFSFLLPLIRRIKAQNFSAVFIVTLVFILMPLPFYENYYHSLYIDAFLGMVLGAGLARIVLEEDKTSICYNAYIYSLCFVLTMSKLSGALFAVMLMLAYIWDLPKEQKKFRRIGIFGIIFFLLTTVPLILWNYYVKYFDTQSAVNGKIYPKILWEILIGKDKTYRKNIFDVFKLALFNNSITGDTPRFSIGNMGFSINYFALLIFFVILFCAICLFIRNKSQKTYRSIVIVMTALAINWLVFYISLCLTYLFRFDEETSMRLASYSRYIHTVYLPFWLLLLTLTFWFIYEYYPKSSACVFCLCIVLLITPMKDMAEFLFRDQVSESIENRQAYIELITKIKKWVQPDSRIYFICQNETHYISGAAYWQIGFEVRPIRMQDAADGWMLAPESKNWYISDLDILDWKQRLIESYDYVAIYEIDQYFCETFSVLFTNPSEISNNSVYVVNKETGLLELCE